MQALYVDNVSDDVKEACMDLLASLCKSSKKGKEAISNADECSSCIAFASDHTVTHANIYKDDTSSESVGDLLDTMMVKAPDSSTQPIKNDDWNIVLSSITFLSSIVHMKASRIEIIQDNDLKEALCTILENSPYPIMKFAIVSFFAALARYAKDFANEESSYSVQNLSSTLLLVFNPKQVKQGARLSVSERSTPLFGDFSAMHHYNDNLVLATAAAAFENILCHMSQELGHEVLLDLLQKFSDIIKYETKTTKKIAVKTRNSGLLVCNISSILFHCATRNEYQDMIKEESLLFDLLRIILLNPGEKLVEGKKDSSDDIKAREDEKTNWNCSVMYCLQCLAVLSIEPLEMGDGVKTWDDIMSHVETEIQISRKGRRSTSLRMVDSVQAKNKTLQVTIIGSLKEFMNNSSNPGSSVAARKIIDNLDI